MKRILVLTIVFGALAAGCSTTSSRVSRHRAAFDTWPAEVREKVQAGQVAVGFTPEQVEVALGEPERKFTRSTAEGSSEVWVYQKKGPRFSVGVGGGSYGGSGGVGGGVSVGGGEGDADAMRVVFSGGRVSAIEQRTR